MLNQFSAVPVILMTLRRLRSRGWGGGVKYCTQVEENEDGEWSTVSGMVEVVGNFCPGRFSAVFRVET